MTWSSMASQSRETDNCFAEVPSVSRCCLAHTCSQCFGFKEPWDVECTRCCKSGECREAGCSSRAYFLNTSCLLHCEVIKCQWGLRGGCGMAAREDTFSCRQHVDSHKKGARVLQGRLFPSSEDRKQFKIQEIRRVAAAEAWRRWRNRARELERLNPHASNSRARQQAFEYIKRIARQHTYPASFHGSARGAADGSGDAARYVAHGGRRSSIPAEAVEEQLRKGGDVLKPGELRAPSKYYFSGEERAGWQVEHPLECQGVAKAILRVEQRLGRPIAQAAFKGIVEAVNHRDHIQLLIPEINNWFGKVTDDVLSGRAVTVGHAVAAAVQLRLVDHVKDLFNGLCDAEDGRRVFDECREIYQEQLDRILERARAQAATEEIRSIDGDKLGESLFEEKLKMFTDYDPGSSCPLDDPGSCGSEPAATSHQRAAREEEIVRQERHRQQKQTEGLHQQAADAAFQYQQAQEMAYMQMMFEGLSFAPSTGGHPTGRAGGPGRDADFVPDQGGPKFYKGGTYNLLGGHRRGVEYY